MKSRKLRMRVKFMPDCAHSDFGLAYVNSLVTAVGGDKSQSEPTNILLSLVRGNRWSQHFPPMQIKRFEPAVACSDHLLVAAGGKTELGGGRLCTVEVMNTVTRHWYLAASLHANRSQWDVHDNCW